MAAWIKQLKKQVDKFGPEKASWHVEWDEPSGRRPTKSCGPGRTGKKSAERLQKKIRAQLTLGTYDSDERKQKRWEDFVNHYLEYISSKATKTVSEARVSLHHFGRILNLDGTPVSLITTWHVDEFIKRRRSERGEKPASQVSPATVNKDLRMVKAALRLAREWKFLDEVPRFKFERETKRLPTYVTPEDFAAIYQACDVATQPTQESYSPSTWWRGLLVMAQMTGWRIGEILKLEWADVDLDSCTAITRARSNKGNRDEMVVLHPVVIDHLRPLLWDHPIVFPWPHHRRTLDVEFARIQDAAGIKLRCREDRPHTCTEACHRYGFHDERRAFATMNAPNMSREALQALMRHQSPNTTDRYINFAQQLNPAVANLHVPEVLKSNSE